MRPEAGDWLRDPLAWRGEAVESGRVGWKWSEAEAGDWLREPLAWRGEAVEVI